MQKRNRKKVTLTRAEKIILTMYKTARGEKRNFKFEDLVVELFKAHPDHFHLKGHPAYPDSESVNNALYHNLKKKGVISYGNKTFSLTDKGLDYARALQGFARGRMITTFEKLDRYVEKELVRIKRLEPLAHYLNKEYKKILDTDFYDYLGVTVRTEKADFIARLRLIDDVMKSIKKSADETNKTLIKFHKFMMKKFSHEWQYKSKA